MKHKHLEILKSVEYLRKDKTLNNLIDKYPVWRPYKKTNFFEEIVDEIINQQLSDKASARISKRFRDFFGGKFPMPENVLKTPSKDIRGVGISWAKVSYIKDLASRIVDKRLDFNKLKKMEPEKIRETLLQVKGVGNWTVDMILMFTFVELDIMPLGDSGIQRALRIIYNKVELTKEEMIKISDKWKPYRSVACYYLWQSLG